MEVEYGFNGCWPKREFESKIAVMAGQDTGKPFRVNLF